MQSIIFRNLFICVEESNYMNNYMKVRREALKVWWILNISMWMFFNLRKSSFLPLLTQQAFFQSIVRNGVQAPSLFKAPTSWPSLPPPKIFVSPTQIPPALTRPTNLFWFKQISKRWIYQFNCRFMSILIF